jgi:hypothetical protein
MLLKSQELGNSEADPLCWIKRFLPELLSSESSQVLEGAVTFKSCRWAEQTSSCSTGREFVC